MYNHLAIAYKARYTSSGVPNNKFPHLSSECWNTVHNFSLLRRWPFSRFFLRPRRCWNSVLSSLFSAYFQSLCCISIRVTVEKKGIYNFLHSLTWVELNCYPKFKYPSAVYANFQVDSAQFGVQTLSYCFEIHNFFVGVFLCADFVVFLFNSLNFTPRKEEVSIIALQVFC